MVRSSTERSNAFYIGCVVWVAGCVWLIHNDLGSIAFVGTVLLAIWVFGLREKFEGEDGPSAYSVFNKGGRAILGGFTGEQLDQQMRGGMTYAGSISDKAKVESDAPLTTTGGASTSTATSSKLSGGEKLKRRSAAAAAAERRLEFQKAQQEMGVTK